MKIRNRFYFVRSFTMVVALLLIQGATISPSGVRHSNTIYTHGYNVNSNISDAYLVNVTLPNNKRDMGRVRKISDRDDLTWWQDDYEKSFPEASFPFFDDFETGTLGSNWTISTTNQGHIRVDSYHPYSGTYGLLLDDSQSDSVWSIAAAILTIDLSGQSQVELDFWWDEYGTMDDAEDGVFISDDSGSTWYRALSFNADPTTWRHQIIDLDTAAVANGLTLNDHFQIKFQFYDDDPIPTDGYAIDEVQVRAPNIPSPASFPYYTGFESGALGNEWLTGFTNEGRVRVDSYHPYTGTYSLLLDDWQNDSIWSIAAAILTIDLSGQSQVELDFWWDEYGTMDDAEDGVFISDDNGTTWYRTLSFDADPTTWRHQIIDLDAAAATNGLTLNDHFQIKFQFYDDDPIPTDGYAIDEVQVRVNAAPTLVWLGDTNFQQDGLHPESGGVSDDYNYRIKYTDIEADAPDSVHVHIQKASVDIGGSPFAMTCATGDYTSGVACAYTKTGLEAGTDYTYYFVAKDDQGNSAVPTIIIDAPNVTIRYTIYIPMGLQDAGPPAEPVLNTIINPSGNYIFTVSWSAVERATSYTLEEDDNASFSSPVEVYTGSDTSTLVSVSAIGTYYYRVKASNSLSESDWSNTQSVIVTITPPLCPQAGSWSGTGEDFNLDFEVAVSGNTCRVQNITGSLSAYCHYGGSNWSLFVEFLLSMTTISNHEFYTSDEDTNISGVFITPNMVEGTWSYYHVFPYPPATCSGSGSWTGSYEP